MKNIEAMQSGKEIISHQEKLYYQASTSNRKK